MRTKLAIIGAAVCLARAAFAVTMASQPWTTNRIAEAEARVAVKITAATNAIPAPDFSQNNAQLRETIVAVSPPADLTEATNHTRAALSAFAGTGTVERARSYGTPTRWTDATGGVWEVGYSDWVIEYNDPEMAYYGVRLIESGQGDGAYWIPYIGEAPSGEAKGYADSTEIVWLNEAIADFRATRTLLGTTNLVGRVALTNDIPDVSGYATQQQATNAATAVADTKISTNNAAFVSAVTNCPVVIASTNRVGGVKVDGTSVTITDGAISSHVDPLNKMWEFRLSDGGGATAKAVGRIIGVSDNTALVYCQLKDTSDIEWSSYISYYLFSMIIDFNSDAYTAISGVTDGSTFAGVVATLYFADAYTIMQGDKPSTTEIEYSTVVFKDVATSN